MSYKTTAYQGATVVKRTISPTEIQKFAKYCYSILQELKLHNWGSLLLNLEEGEFNLGIQGDYRVTWHYLKDPDYALMEHSFFLYSNNDHGVVTVKPKVIAGEFGGLHLALQESAPAYEVLIRGEFSDSAAEVFELCHRALEKFSTKIFTLRHPNTSDWFGISLEQLIAQENQMYKYFHDLTALREVAKFHSNGADQGFDNSSLYVCQDNKRKLMIVDYTCTFNEKDYCYRLFCADPATENLHKLAPGERLGMQIGGQSWKGVPALRILQAIKQQVVIGKFQAIRKD